MKEKLKYYLKEIVVFSILLFVATNAISFYKSTELTKENFPLSQITLYDNTSFSYDKNKPILLHFWTTWCPTCKIEASTINALSKDYQVITVVVKAKNKAQIQNYLKKNNLSFNVIDDKNGTLATQFHIPAYPTTLIYNTQQNLIFSEVGYSSTIGLKIRLWLATF